MNEKLFCETLQPKLSEQYWPNLVMETNEKLSNDHYYMGTRATYFSVSSLNSMSD